ncbi:MAG: UDP-N-acetylmuramate dehydrogenase [Myxococcales bacterium]|nr:UDP-N-acetylmuramate dehydrogenase [Myxococcales bacterium]
MKVVHDAALAPRTSLGVGGSARRLVLLETLDEAEHELARIDEPFYLLGGGSNVVIADEGLFETVLSLQARGLAFRELGGDATRGEVELTAAAGEPWDALVAACVERGLGGLECLSGIPGLVGATPIQNVGAYGQEVADCVSGVRIFDLRAREVRELARAECRFAYRDSDFKSGTLRGRAVVLAVRYRLRRGAPAAPRYGELSRALERDVGAAASDGDKLRATRQTVLALRAAKGMLIADDARARDGDSRSAGSFFLNPVVSCAEADAVQARARALGALGADEAMPRFGAGRDGHDKLAAAWLIERAGFHKGYGEGAVGLSSKHTLALINRGGARGADVVALALEIQRGVEQRLGVRLHPEPQLLGFAPDNGLAAPATPMLPGS